MASYNEKRGYVSPPQPVKRVPSRAELPDHEARMQAARRAARWYLGNRDWADKIIGYYLDPENALPVLAEAMGEYGVEMGA